MSKQDLAGLGKYKGSSLELAGDANRPTFDAAEHEGGTGKVIQHLFAAHESALSPWEMGFLSDIYGKEPLTRKQHITVYRIHKRFHSEEAKP